MYFIFIITAILVFFFVVFMFYPNIIKLIPIISNVEFYQRELSTLYLKKGIVDSETTILSLCNTTPKSSHFQDDSKNANIDVVLKEYNHINYGQIFFIVYHYNKRIKFIKYELRVYSFVLIFLTIACLLFQLDDKGQIRSTVNIQMINFVVPIQILLVVFFVIRLTLEVNNIQQNIDRIILSKRTNGTYDFWKKAEIISKILAAIAAFIGLIIYILKALDT